MQTSCYRCGWNLALTKDELTAALEAIQSGRASHYDARCPRCRAVNKIPADRIRRAAPRPPAAVPDQTGEKTSKE